MYLHPLHRFADPAAFTALMAAHPLGAWVCQGTDGLVANHLPFWLDPAQGPHGRLLAHVSRANPVWRQLGEGLPSVVLFQGPQAYVSPGWYPGKAAHGRVVPTWNYAAVHVHGVARLLQGQYALLGLLKQLTNAHEAAQPAPWQVEDAPADYIQAMLLGVVGIELTITRIEGRLKASQDEALEDRHGTVQGLRARGGDANTAVAAAVQQALDDEAHAPTPPQTSRHS